MLVSWPGPGLAPSLLFRPGAVRLGVREPQRGWRALAARVLGDAVVNPVVVGSLQQGCFFLPVWVQTETVNTESIFTRRRLMCGAVKRGVDTSGNSPYFSRLLRGSGRVMGAREMLADDVRACLGRPVRP